MKKNNRKIEEKKISILKRTCLEHGIKLTHQRIEIFLEVTMAKDHPSAEDIFKRVRMKLPTISLDTVYRTLTTFDRCGLISKAPIFDDRTRFDPNTEHHHHMVCVKCKDIKDFEWPDFEEAPLPAECKDWSKIETKHVQIRGVCPKCLV
jgi:Fur family peroxide stress response transcriptional regulator